MESGLLDCTSAEAAVKSIVNIFGINESDLHAVFQDIGQVPRVEAPEYYIPPRVYRALGKPEFPIQSLWFHATRVEDPASFKKVGILPKRKVIERLTAFLKRLSKGLEKHGDHPNPISACWKADNPEDEGPFAFLFRTLAIEAPGAIGAYHEAPEAVEDIAGDLLGENYKELVSRFQAETVPCIVSFKAHIGEHRFNRALWFAHMIYSGIDELEAQSAAKTFYVGDGTPIPPKKIIDVEVIL